MFTSEHLQRRADALDEKAKNAVTDLSAQSFRASARRLRDAAQQQTKDANLAFRRFRRLKLEAWCAAGGSTSDFDVAYPKASLRCEFVEQRADAIETERARGARRWARAFWK